MSLMSNARKIGIERIMTPIGDLTLGIKALYMLRQMFDGEIILYTTKIGQNLFKHLDFIDKIVVISNMQEFETALDNDELDILILTHRRSDHIRAAKRSKTKKIISELHMHNLFHPRFKTRFLPIVRLNNFAERSLKLVKMIDKKKFDEISKIIDYNKAKIKTSKENKEHIAQIIKELNPDNKRFIGVNCFGSSSNYNFSLDTWLELVNKFANEFNNFLFVIMTYSGELSKNIPEQNKENIRIFKNNDDILNLVEFTKHLDLFISLNTGNIHIADNLKIPTICIMKQYEQTSYIGGIYGGEFQPLFLPKNWKNDYNKYVKHFRQMVIQRLKEMC